jgi:hypothetical protein
MKIVLIIYFYPLSVKIMDKKLLNEMHNKSVHAEDNIHLYLLFTIRYSRMRIVKAIIRICGCA